MQNIIPRASTVRPPPGQPALREMKFIPVDLDLIKEKGRELKARFSEIFH
jgi:hypothetical protein